MISKWKKLSIISLLGGAGFLVACNASDKGSVETEKAAREEVVESISLSEIKKIDEHVQLAALDQGIAIENESAVNSVGEVKEKVVKDVISIPETKKVEKPIQLAAVDQSIPVEKYPEEGLPEASGLEDGKSAPEVAKDTSVKLVNPFTGDAEKIEAGKKKWFSFGCSGCHGGGGGGGMCPSVINEKWVYGGRDDVLFRLITLGSDQLMEQGHRRVKKESVAAPMPQVGEMTNMTTEDVWLVLTYMRAKFKGREEKIEW